MPQKIDLTGNRYGRLLVLREVPSEYKRVYWLCLCDCGNTKAISSNKLRNGNTKSCRCLDTEKTIERTTTHGMTGAPEHNTWAGIIQRCTNAKSGSYKDYGGRGIKVCDRWKSFENFYADMGAKPTPSHTLDRIDNNGDYTPENCRWADRLTQANNKRNNHRITFNGESKTLPQWARITGIDSGTIRARIGYGWSVEDALTKPLLFNVSNKTGVKGVSYSVHGHKNYLAKFQINGRVFRLGRFYTLEEAAEAVSVFRSNNKLTENKPCQV